MKLIGPCRTEFVNWEPKTVSKPYMCLVLSMVGTQLIKKKKRSVAQNLKIRFHNESIDCVCVCKIACSEYNRSALLHGNSGLDFSSRWPFRKVTCALLAHSRHHSLLSLVLYPAPSPMHGLCKYLCLAPFFTRYPLLEVIQKSKRPLA